MTHTSPSVVGRVAATKISGTITAPSVPNMNRSTAIAIGTAMISPLLRSLL